MKLISVIIPIYKVEKFIGRCLDCLIAQTYPHWEAICVNDGSPDSSRDIVLRYAERDTRIKLVEKSNGGLPSARNAGMQAVSGEYVIFLDSDDFLHPQTIDFAVCLAERDGSDMVTWYKHPNYRNITFIRHKLGLDTIDYRPYGYRKEFDLAKVRSRCTGKLYEHLTEYSHPKGIDWPMKHFYVWRMMTRTSLIGDHRFYDDIRCFEDFPWWPEILLKKPVVTMTKLPFHFYYPNFGSIDLSSSRLKKIRYWCLGLEKAWKVMADSGEDEIVRAWSHNCRWPVINIQIAKRLDSFDPSAAECEFLVGILRKLKADGAFSNPETKADRKSLAKINSFIGE